MNTPGMSEMTMLDFFAAMCISGTLAGPLLDDEQVMEKAAQAYRMAHALIAVRESLMAESKRG